MTLLVCEICESKIATFDPAAIHLPLTPDQFGPAESGFPEPFHPDADWSSLMCPICGNRAVGWDAESPEGVRWDRVLTPTGYFVVGVDGAPVAIIPFDPDYSALEKEWDALEREKYGLKQNQAPIQEKREKRPYHRRDSVKGNKRGR